MPRNKEFDYDEKLEVARNLFWEKGYNATSMLDIVDRMQLNRSSIYDTYGNKHDLFLKSLEHYASFKKKQYVKASRAGKLPIDTLEYIIRDVVKQTLTTNRSCLIVKSIFEVAHTDPEVKELILENGNLLQEILVHSIKQAQVDGSIKSTTEPTVIARFILSAFSSFWSHFILSQNKKEVYEMVDYLIEQIKK